MVIAQWENEKKARRTNADFHYRVHTWRVVRRDVVGSACCREGQMIVTYTEAPTEEEIAMVKMLLSYAEDENMTVILTPRQMDIAKELLEQEEE